MWFQLQFRANVIWTSAGVMTVPWGGPFNIAVTLRSKGLDSEEEQLEGLKCQALAQLQASPEALQIFQELQAGVQGKEADEDWYWELRELPKAFQSFIRDVQEQLSRPAHRIIRLLRWRFDLTGSREVSSWQSFQWSLDGNSWWPMPHSLIAGLDLFSESINPSPDLGEISTEAALSDLLAAGLDEPVGHSLIREAWEQRYRSPSTSLILGITAAEIGVKQCIATLSPDTAWLVQEVQAPPVERMLEEYLPKLPLKNKVEEGVSALSKTLKREITQGRRIRNELIHNPAASPPAVDKVKKVLLAVKDILSLCDYYCGVEWASSRMRQETREHYFPSQGAGGETTQ
jgi:hypothetical protein